MPLRIHVIVITFWANTRLLQADATDFKVFLGTGQNTHYTVSAEALFISVHDTTFNNHQREILKILQYETLNFKGDSFSDRHNKKDKGLCYNNF